MPNTAPRPFGELLRKHRIAAGVSQEELAERARLSANTISALERGVRRKPYLDTIALLADALHLSHEARSELERSAVRRGAAIAADARPSGSVTLLFTTIEDGESRWEEQPEAMCTRRSLAKMNSCARRLKRMVVMSFASATNCARCLRVAAELKSSSISTALELGLGCDATYA